MFARVTLVVDKLEVGVDTAHPKFHSLAVLRALGVLGAEYPELDLPPSVAVSVQPLSNEEVSRA